MSDTTTETVESIENVAGRVAEASRRARERARELVAARYERVTDLARANPTATALTGLALGYIVGRLAAR
ncbi:MAG: hypothetical protein K8W52_23700 [Deltaproteobacteria bacterium]|nr:hypothetical protein [Deltaproteobacteria bacterium]